MDRRRQIPKPPEPHHSHRAALDAPVSDAARRSAALESTVTTVADDAEEQLPAKGAAGAAGRLRRDRYAMHDDDDVQIVSVQEQQRRMAIRARAEALSEGR